MPGGTLSAMSTSEASVGSRFRRALTAQEMSEITHVMVTEGGAAGFREMWSRILLEAEGVTWAEAVERGLKFHPSDYALPTAQAVDLRALMTVHRGRDDTEVNVSMTWFNDGPASYEP